MMDEVRPYTGAISPEAESVHRRPCTSDQRVRDADSLKIL
jgi:hypothetical protein